MTTEVRFELSLRGYGQEDLRAVAFRGREGCPVMTRAGSRPSVSGGTRVQMAA